MATKIISIELEVEDQFIPAEDVIEDIVEGVLYSMSAVRLVWANTQFGTMVVRKSTYDLTDLDFSDESDGLSLITQNK